VYIQKKQIHGLLLQKADGFNSIGTFAAQMQGGYSFYIAAQHVPGKRLIIYYQAAYGRRVMHILLTRFE
jgi:hypothetical protein